MLAYTHRNEVAVNPGLALHLLESPKIFSENPDLAANLSMSEKLPEETQKIIYSSLLGRKDNQRNNAAIINNLLSNPGVSPEIIKHLQDSIDIPLENDDDDTINSNAIDLDPSTRMKAKHYNMHFDDIFASAVDNYKLAKENKAKDPKDITTNAYSANSIGYNGDNFSFEKTLKNKLANDDLQDLDSHTLNRATEPEHVAYLSKVLDDMNMGKTGKPHPGNVNLAHILTKHPNKEVSDKAFEYSKSDMDYLIHDLDREHTDLGGVWGDIFKSKPDSVDLLKKYANSDNPILQNYVKKHPVVRYRRDTLNSQNAGDDTENDVYGLDQDRQPYLKDPLAHKPTEKGQDLLKVDSGTRVSEDPDDLDYNKTVKYDLSHNKNDHDTVLAAYDKHWQHPATYNFLSQSEDPIVREHLALNRHTPTETLKTLASDPHKPVRQNIIKHPNMTHDILNVLRQDKDPEIRTAASDEFFAKKAMAVIPKKPKALGEK